MSVVSKTYKTYKILMMQKHHHFFFFGDKALGAFALQKLVTLFQ